MPANFISRGKDKLQRAAIDMLFQLGLERAILAERDGAAILCYHGIDLSGSKDLNMRFISRDSIERHFIYFKKYFNVITVADYFEKKFDKTKFNIAITFDDGYRNNFLYLIPLIEKFQIPVSIYVTGINNTSYKYLWADFADIVSLYSLRHSFTLDESVFHKSGNKYLNQNGSPLKKVLYDSGSWTFKEEFLKLFENEFFDIVSKNNLDDYWQLITDDEIIIASNSKFVSIGSHGFYHNNLDSIPYEDAISELQLSKEYLENLTQKTVSEIAYPHGAYTRGIINAAYNMGYSRQLALKYRYAEDYVDSRIECRHDIYPVYSDYYQIAAIPQLS
jgi:peptidoglycan/xylan/chitin deacetylase (PgdA/CDA1 family)